MAVALVTGVFAVLLAVLSWLLTNGSKRGRLLSRIERQTAVLKDLPPEHPARVELDQSLVFDITELKALGRPRSPTSADVGAIKATRLDYRSSRASVIAALGSAILAAAATVVSAYLGR